MGASLSRFFAIFALLSDFFAPSIIPVPVPSIGIIEGDLPIQRLRF